MSSRDIENDDFEWDKKRCVATLVIMVIVASVVWTAVNMYQPGVTVQNVSYTMDVSSDAERFNTLHGTFFGGSSTFENVTIVTVSIIVAQIPSVDRLAIIISTVLPTHLMAVILAEFQNENNVLHGTSSIDAGQVNYAITVDGGGMDLVLYLFLENVEAGSFRLVVRAYQGD